MVLRPAGIQTGFPSYSEVNCTPCKTWEIGSRKKNRENQPSPHCAFQETLCHPPLHKCRSFSGISNHDMTFHGRWCTNTPFWYAAQMLLSGPGWSRSRGTRILRPWPARAERRAVHQKVHSHHVRCEHRDLGSAADVEGRKEEEGEAACMKTLPVSHTNNPKQLDNVFSHSSWR